MHTSDFTRVKVLDLQSDIYGRELAHMARRTTESDACGLLRQSADRLRAHADQIEADLEKPRPQIASWGDPSPNGGDSGLDYQEFPVS